jgi:nicotinamidase-related amidase
MKKNRKVVKSLVAVLITGLLCSCVQVQKIIGHEKSDTAVVLVDMQMRFLDMWSSVNKSHGADDSRAKMALRMQSASDLMHTQASLLEWAKKRKYPVLVFEYNGQGSTVYSLKKIIDGFPNHFYVVKHADGGFEGSPPPSPDPEEILKRLGVHRLIVTGTNGHHCVKDTVVQALDRGFQVVTSADLAATIDYTGGPYHPSADWWPTHSAFTGYDSFEQMKRQLR